MIALHIKQSSNNPTLLSAKKNTTMGGEQEKWKEQIVHAINRKNI